MFSPVSVCLSVTVTLCPPNYSNTYEWILMKFFRGVGRGRSNNCLDFGSSPGHRLDPGIFLKDTCSRLYRVSFIC